MAIDEAQDSCEVALAPTCGPMTRCRDWPPDDLIAPVDDVVGVKEEHQPMSCQKYASRNDVAPGTRTPPTAQAIDGTETDHAADWRRQATELADWMLPLVVRDDCHGGHRLCDDGRQMVERTTYKSPLTRDVLVDHFAAEDARAVCGLHISSPDERCLLVVVDIDAHGDPGDDPEQNRAFARHVHEEAGRLGFAVLLLDSNGRGGYHVWVLLGQMTPMAQACRLGKYLVRDHRAFGLVDPPETFPKRPCLSGKRFGGWVRIFGRHHKRPFWTRVWDERCGRWQEGEAAIKLILGTTPVPMDAVAVLPPDFSAEPHREGPAGDAPAWRPLEFGHRRRVRLAEAALSWLRGGEVDRYDDWFATGMSLKALGEDGLRLWDAWSRRSEKYRSGETGDKWETFQTGDDGGPGMLGLGTLFRRAEAYGFKGHRASRRWAEYLEHGPGVLDPGEDPDRMADEARDQKFSLACDEAVATLEARPDLRAELAAAWGVSERTTRLIGAGLREDLDLWMDRYMPTGRWAITVPLSSAGLTVGYVKIYAEGGRKPRLARDSRPGLVVPWDLEARDGPLVVCGDPADTARALELGARAVGLAEPDAPLDDLAAFLAPGTEVVVAPGAGRWADDTACRLGRLTGRRIMVLRLPDGAGRLRDCIMSINAPQGQEDDDGGD
jgi:hypothetical protein